MEIETKDLVAAIQYWAKDSQEQHLKAVKYKSTLKQVLKELDVLTKKCPQEELSGLKEVIISVLEE